MNAEETLENAIEREKAHDRIEQRRAFLLRDLKWLQDHHQWPGLSSVVVIKSTRIKGDKVSTETRYYLSSLKTRSAREFNNIVRAHWSIKNQLHWCLGCSFYEKCQEFFLCVSPGVQSLMSGST